MSLEVCTLLYAINAVCEKVAESLLGGKLGK